MQSTTRDRSDVTAFLPYTRLGVDAGGGEVESFDESLLIENIASDDADDCELDDGDGVFKKHGLIGDLTMFIDDVFGDNGLGVLYTTPRNTFSITFFFKE